MKRAWLVVALVVARAGAEPAKLTLSHEPPPRHLRMRPHRAAAVVRPEPAAAPSPIPRPPDPGYDAVSLRDIQQPVSARVNMGYVVEGVALTGVAPPSGKQDFAAIHAYGFGEGYLATRGVGLDSVSTYLATQFQITRRNLTYDPLNPAANSEGIVAQPPPIANWFERSGVEPRAVWAEAKDFLPDHRLAPLRVRAGELYVYGPWVLHIYGLTTAWDGKLVSGTLYGGSRVPDYTLVQTTAADRAGIGGTTVKVDLRDLKSPIPFTISVEGLAFSAAGASQPARYGQLQVDWRPWGDFALIGQARTTENALVNEHVQLRSRYHQVTNIVVDFTHRHSSDWRWDPSVTEPDPLAAKRYLDLGPTLPQAVVSVRAGTLVKENIDIYARGAVASDLGTPDDQKSTYSASYVEAGGAIELRLRRTIALGASGLTRQTQRIDHVSNEIVDQPNMPDRLLPNASPAMGERGFTELGTSVRMSLGAREFSLLLEIYGRRTKYALDYCNGAVSVDCQSALDTGIPTSDLRFGWRVSVDAWIGKRLRLLGSYELSSKLDFAPEITGYKSLRLMMEGIY